MEEELEAQVEEEAEEGPKPNCEILSDPLLGSHTPTLPHEHLCLRLHTYTGLGVWGRSGAHQGAPVRLTLARGAAENMRLTRGRQTRTP